MDIRSPRGQSDFRLQRARAAIGLMRCRLDRWAISSRYSLSISSRKARRVTLITRLLAAQAASQQRPAQAAALEHVVHTRSARGTAHRGHTAHTIRPSLFATASWLYCGRVVLERSPPTDGVASPVSSARRRRCAASSTARAPCVSKHRRYTSPRLLMPPSRRRAPLEYSRGVSPSQLANWRARRNVWMCPTVPTSAVAVNSPIPGMLAQARRRPDRRRRTRSSRSRCATRVSICPDLLLDAREHRCRWFAERCLRLLHDRRNRLHCGARARGQQQSLLAQDPAESVDARGPRRHPLLTHAMQRDAALVARRA